MRPSFRSTLATATLCSTLALSACGPMTGGRATTNVPDAANLIDYRDIRAVSKDQTEALRAVLANSSFLVRMVWGRQYVHFAPSGQAYFWDTRDRTTVTGSWNVRPASFGTDYVCWEKPDLPEDNCIVAASFIGMADYLSRGDVFGLTTGNAPE